MAVYTAKKLNPRVEGDLFKVDVEIYADGVLAKTQTFETNQTQPDTWPAEGVKRLIQSLQEVPTLPTKIAAGDLAIPVDAARDAAKDAWLALDSQYWRLKQYVDDGLITSANTPAAWTQWMNLKAKRTADFRPAFVI